VVERLGRCGGRVARGFLGRERSGARSGGARGTGGAAHQALAGQYGHGRFLLSGGAVVGLAARVVGRCAPIGRPVVGAGGDGGSGVPAAPFGSPGAIDPSGSRRPRGVAVRSRGAKRWGRRDRRGRPQYRFLVPPEGADASARLGDRPGRPAAAYPGRYRWSVALDRPIDVMRVTVSTDSHLVHGEVAWGRGGQPPSPPSVTTRTIGSASKWCVPRGSRATRVALVPPPLDRVVSAGGGVRAGPPPAGTAERWVLRSGAV
jgi:hypothetical protein